MKASTTAEGRLQVVPGDVPCADQQILLGSTLADRNLRSARRPESDWAASLLQSLPGKTPEKVVQ